MRRGRRAAHRRHGFRPPGRARQISIEAETEHIPLEDKPVTIAIHEVADGKLAAVVKE